MTARRRPAPAVDRRIVLICAGCRYAWEPADEPWSAEHLQAFCTGCPVCGDWLYLGELANPPATEMPSPRRPRS
jgi:hypothetical protein